MFHYWISLVLLTSLTQGLQVTTSGKFSNCQPSGGECTFSQVLLPDGSTEHQVRWAKSTGYGRSGLGYAGLLTNFTLEPLAVPQLVGVLRHYNWPVTGKVPETVDLTLNLTTPTQLFQVTFTLDIHETLNRETDLINGTCPFSSNPEWMGEWNTTYPCCPYWTPEKPCSDRIRFLSPVSVNESFAINQTLFTLRVDGFFEEISNIEPGILLEFFVTQEGNVSDGYLFGRLVQTCVDTCPSDLCFLGECIGGTCEFSPTHACPCFEDCQTCMSHQCQWCFFEDSGTCVQEDPECMTTCSPPPSSDDDDTDITGAIVAAVVGCCGLCFLLLLGSLTLAVLGFLSRTKKIPTISGFRNGKWSLQDAHDNPLHEGKTQDHTNPLFESLN